MKRQIFRGNNPYEALSNAQKYLINSGYSFGVEDDKNHIGIKKGSVIVSRWSYMSEKEIQELDGIIESKNFRGNRVTVIIYNQS